MNQRKRQGNRIEALALGAMKARRASDDGIAYGGAMGVTELNEESFDDWVQAQPSVRLVNFWADWCQPCRRLEPLLDELAQEFQGKALIASVDIDNSGDLANRFGIRSVPTLVVFRGGRIVDQLVGAAPIEQIRNLLHKQL